MLPFPVGGRLPGGHEALCGAQEPGKVDVNLVNGVHVSQQQPCYGATRSTAGNENGYAVLYTIKWRYYSGDAGMVGSMCGFYNRTMFRFDVSFFRAVCRCLVVVAGSS